MTPNYIKIYEIDKFYDIICITRFLQVIILME